MTHHTDPAVTDDPRAVAQVRDLMESIDIAMLTTIDAGVAGGRLTSRPLSTQIAEADGDVLFLVRRDSSVVADIEADPRVNVAYTSSKAWVSVAGRAYVVTDRDLVASLWSKGAAAFMAGGPENPDNVVLKVETDTAELWGSDSTVASVVKTLKVVAGTDDSGSTTVDLP